MILYETDTDSEIKEIIYCKLLKHSFTTMTNWHIVLLFTGAHYWNGHTTTVLSQSVLIFSMI